MSAIRNPEGPLVGGCFNTELMYFLIRAKVSVLHREVGRSWEGPLREASLYHASTTSYSKASVFKLVNKHSAISTASANVSMFILIVFTAYGRNKSAM